MFMLHLFIYLADVMLRKYFVLLKGKSVVRSMTNSHLTLRRIDSKMSF